ncbi:effector-associated constant component EACC1 [Streptomyces sp. NPDC003753]|uniref:effector-associated constant component EACC1 n=1 Tax=unclassified Streptomyces TaxID=2593676 RepID=UPI001906B3BD|nr:hypothetical protein [Streptomyces sp. Y2F8-2]
MIFGFDGDEQTVAGHTQSLAAWFDDTENLARAEITKLSRPPVPGRQGAFDEALRVYAESGQVLAAALTAYCNWLLYRVKSRSVPVKVTCPNGVEITATARSEQDVPRIKAKILRDCAM